MRLPCPSISFLALAIALLTQSIRAEVPDFDADINADRWLRASSPFYRTMAEAVDRDGGYVIRRGAEHPKGVVTYENGRRFIELNDTLKGPERVSILIFELTNAWQQSKHTEIDEAARNGQIVSAREFGIRHELVELDGLRLHRRVLAELEPIAGEIPRSMFTWINPELTTLAGYEIPFAHDFIKAQEGGGHTAHYWKWFGKQAAMGRAARADVNRESPPASEAASPGSPAR